MLLVERTRKGALEESDILMHPDSSSVHCNKSQRIGRFPRLAKNGYPWRLAFPLKFASNSGIIDFVPSYFQRHNGKQRTG